MESAVKGPKPILKHKHIGGFEMRQVIAKIANAPMSAPQARALRNIIKEINEKVEAVGNAYKEEVMKVHFKHDEKGEPVVENNDYVLVDPSPEGVEAAKKAGDEFGEREVEISTYIRPSMLAEVKGVTAREMDLLDALVADEDGPGLPANVTPLR